MEDELRDCMVAFLLKHRICVLTTSGTGGAWAMPARYRPLAEAVVSRHLEVECLLPRWADAIYHLEQCPQALLIIVEAQGIGLRWLQYQATAQPVALPDWPRLLPRGVSQVRPEDRYSVVRLTPQRIDLIDESRGWGARETLDL